MKVERFALDGVLMLDKPAGWSSNDALSKVKGLLAARKAGHTGTLDPFATGLLPICFGEATKFSADLLEADKGYEATARLGVTTTTGDIEGEVVAVNAVNVSREQLDAVVTQFCGSIEQVPPMYSALKHGGRPLYEYARAGQEVVRLARQVRIEALQTLSLEGDTWCFRVRCSKGTYIRTLAEDIGLALGCGAHLLGLRRTQVAQWSVTQASTLDSLQAMTLEQRQQACLPVDALLQTLPALHLSDADAVRFCHGQRLKLSPLPSGAPARLRVYQASDARLLGTAQCDETGRLQPERLIAVKN